MKANEFRIRNLFITSIPIEGSWIEQQKIDKDIYQVKPCTFQIDKFEYFKGIPLTEEWLLKFGFEKDSIFGVDIKYKIGYFEVWYFRNTDSYMLENIKNMKVFIKYVHQLQNLYFALCNEELVIK